MKILNNIFFYGYAWFLILIAGLPGIFSPRWEQPFDFEVFAEIIFKLDFNAVSNEAMASTINQFRFMKTTVLGFGLFAVLFRQEIFTSKKFNLYFLGILFLGVIARTLSLLIDGQPHLAYNVFTILELVTGPIVFVHSRKTLKEKNLS